MHIKTALKLLFETHFVQNMSAASILSRCRQKSFNFGYKYYFF